MVASSQCCKVKILGILCGAIGAGAVAVWLFFFNRPEGGDASPPEKTAPAGFKDQAREAGIAFRMAFLPKEQGESFKVNLYDHGCGVAVATRATGPSHSV